MVTYQFDIDDDEWASWKRQVPRDKTLDTRIRELLQADREGRVMEPETAPTPDPESTPTRVEETPAEPADDIEWAITETVADWADESDERRQKRIETLRCALEALREKPMSKKQMQTECYEEVPNQNERTWYRKTVRPALGLVSEYDSSSGEYHWVGR